MIFIGSKQPSFLRNPAHGKSVFFEDRVFDEEFLRVILRKIILKKMSLIKGTLKRGL